MVLSASLADYLLLLEQSEQAEAPRLVLLEPFLTVLLSQFLQLVDLVMFHSSFALMMRRGKKFYSMRNRGR